MLNKLFFWNMNKAEAALIRFLKDLGKEVNCSITNVNYGGCCVYASIVSEQLVRKGYGVGGVCSWYGYSEMDIDSARNNILRDQDCRRFFAQNQYIHKLWEDQGVNFGHVATAVFLQNGRRILHDSVETVLAKTTQVEFRKKPIAKGFLYPNEMKALADDSSEWNPDFNRKQIPAMKRIIKEKFNDCPASWVC